MNARRALLSAIAGGFLAALSGCPWSYAPVEARTRFVRAFACPDNRVAVAEEVPVPPGEVRNDPERLRLWHAQQFDPEARYERAEGCGHTALYDCRRIGRYSSVMFCAEP